jgi:hypothetical protein
MIHACGKVYWIRIFIGKLDIFPWMCAADKKKSGSLNWPWSTQILGQFVTRMHQFIGQSDVKHIMTSLIKTITLVLKRHYYKYPWTRLDISDNVCLDLQNCCYSVYVTKLISKSRRVGSFLQSIFIFWLPQPVTLTEILLRME